MDGLSIARQRIAREAEDKTGFLDLGQLALNRLPDELFEMKHLRSLNLGESYFDEAGQRRESESSLGPNSLREDIARVGELRNLHSLCLHGTGLVDLISMKDLVCPAGDRYRFFSDA